MPFVSFLEDVFVETSEDFKFRVVTTTLLDYDLIICFSSFLYLQHHR